MMRTSTKLLDDKQMWRRALARAHPDSGGSHEDFVWIQNVREHVCSGGVNQATSPPPPPESWIVHEDGRESFAEVADFGELTSKALYLVRQNRPHPIARILRLLEDCVSLPRPRREESRGARHKQCAYVAHLAGLYRKHRSEWYSLCEFLALSHRHLAHFITKLKEEQA